MRKSKYTLEKLQPIVNRVKSITAVIRELGLKPSGGTHRLIQSKIRELNIDTSHFTGQLWSKGLKLGENFYGNAKSLEEILVENSCYLTSRLRKRLVSNKIKEDKCETCGINMWNNRRLSLELHHINGNPNDNRLENLQILCPNCHNVIGKPEHLGSKDLVES